MEDVDALAAAITAALTDPAERRRRGAASRQKVLEAFTLDHQIDGLLAAWEAVG